MSQQMHMFRPEIVDLSKSAEKSQTPCATRYTNQTMDERASTNRPKQRSVMGEVPLYDEHAFMKFVPSHQGFKDQTNVSQLTQAMFLVQMNSMNNPTSTTFLIDSGASISGVAKQESLQNAMTCKTPITPAFGEILCATAEGHIRDDIIGPMVIKALHIPAMHQNLLSVHQLCAGGASGHQQVGIFTSEGCRFFNRDSNRDVLQTLSTRRDTIHGLAKQGVYMYSSVNSGSHHN